MRFIYTKTFAVFFFFLVLGVVIVFLQVRGILYPLENIFLQAPRPIAYAIDHTARPVKNFFSVLYRLKSITEENNSLKQQNSSLEQSLVQFQQAKNQNEALKKQLGFVQSSQLQLVACSVISPNPFNVDDAIVLNCGTQNGVSEGDAVVSEGFLVGKILSTEKKSSIALLATSSKFSSDAKLNKSGTTGIVRGSFSAGLILDQLSQNDQADKSDLVITAGINTKIPKNILIGEVGETLSKPSDLFKSTTIISPIDFKNLEFVFAVK